MKKANTLSGWKWHYTRDGEKTLCGRDVTSITNSTGDGCKSCIKAHDKFTEERARLEYATRAAETQDAVMSQADAEREDAAQWDDVATGETFDAGTPVERVSMDVKATTRDGERITYAVIPNGDPQRVAQFVQAGEDCGQFTDVTAEPSTLPESVMVHYGECRTLCGDQPGDAAQCEGGEGPCPNGCDCGCGSGSYECACVLITTDIPAVTCPECREGVHRPVDTPDTVTRLAANGHRMDYQVTGTEYDGRPRLSQWDATHSDSCQCLATEDEEDDPLVVSEYKIEITRHVVSYHAPADHSACEHRGMPGYAHGLDCQRGRSGTGEGECDCHLSDVECDSVRGRWLDGGSREISPAETEVITWDEEDDREQYGPGYGPEVLAAWVEHHLSPLGVFEPSGAPVGPSEHPSAWMSTCECHDDGETHTEISVRLTDGWTPEERAYAFTHITGYM